MFNRSCTELYDKLQLASFDIKHISLFIDSTTSSIFNRSVPGADVCYSVSLSAYKFSTKSMEKFLNIEQETNYDHRHFPPLIIGVIFIVYFLVIFAGITLNGFIMTSIIKNPMLRTPLNILIWNLALSDCFSCLVNAPTTMMEICFKHWLLPDSTFLCKVVGSFQGLVIFVSTLTIVTIAVDRYQIMLHPTGKKLEKKYALIVVFLIWIISLTLVSPLYTVRQLIRDENFTNFENVTICTEHWPVENGRAYYSTFSLVVQYVIPIVIVSFTYTKMYLKVNRRNHLGGISRKELERQQRLLKTNALLVAVALSQGVSWLPLNIINMIDPILYGFYNENLRKECLDMLCYPKVLRNHKSSRKGWVYFDFQRCFGRKNTNADESMQRVVICD
ncbi:neuropeptide F receptor-like [Arctopsyche grandis]|uniref:neuropeptide F receptor-like n=1 Tax=Arctopsyche grandis TaxID=121162 RepID=UPI00406DA2ED